MALMRGFWLAYLFSSFAVGVACLGVAVHLVVRRRDGVSRTFLALYTALSILVTASLGLAFVDTTVGVVPASVRQVFQYLESIVGPYGVMLTLPLFTHRVFAVDDPRRERILIAAVIATLGLQHVTEFLLGSTRWDRRGDWFEDAVLIVLVTYTFAVAISRFRSVEVVQPLARRLVALMLLGAPGIVYDLSYGEGLGLRFYPLWYGVTSVVVTWTLLRDESAAKVAEDSIPVTDSWGLSERELEVADAVARGLSNKEIAAALHISPNTVKTHLRAVFDKAGVRSRFELMSLMLGA